MRHFVNSAIRQWPWIAGGVLFAVVATANGAGYRYGVSDQAFYIPVVTRALDADAFPRDARLIDAQGQPFDSARLNNKVWVTASCRSRRATTK